MLWEVTDGDIDRMTADFLSHWIPSSAKRPWSDVNMHSWNQGKIGKSVRFKVIIFSKKCTDSRCLQFSEFHKDARNKMKFEEDMLVAVAKSKDVCQQYMTSAAIIVRGLPLTLID